MKAVFKQNFVSKMSILLMLGVGFTAHAELKLGAYSGETSTQQKCGIVIESIRFEDNIRHPFSERVSVLGVVEPLPGGMVQMQGAFQIAITLSHPVSVVGEDRIQFNHDILSGFVPFKAPGMAGGGLGFILEKKEIPLENGGHLDMPTRFKIIINQSTPDRELRKAVFVCEGLKLNSIQKMP
ncbi:MAG: hypothetical protein WCH11_07745 [Bdellovibrio sp.]